MNHKVTRETFVCACAKNNESYFCLNTRFFGVAELDNRTFQGELFFNGSSVSHVKHTTVKGNSK